MAKRSDKNFENCNSFGVNHFALILVLLFLAMLHSQGVAFGSEFVFFSDVIFMLSLAVYAVPIFLYELIVVKVYKRDSAKLDFSAYKPDFYRILVKLVGIAGTFASLAFLYWLFPEYQKDMYDIFYRLAGMVLPYAVPLIVIYFLVFDGYSTDKDDEYWHAGCFFLGKWKEIDTTRLAHHARSWAIKGFFLPLMVHYLYNNYSVVLRFPLQEERSFYQIFDVIITLTFIIDLIPVCVGYVLNMKVCDNHIRSTEDTARGWLFCLICYAPIWQLLIYSQYLPYMNGPNWADWLGDHPIRWVWAGLIIGSLLIYSSASICFGTRWSNLTYRGLMCTGPYRITKHPAYVFKSISWWLIAVPFIVDSTWQETIRQCAMILFVNFIYYQRAITEERHLSRHPEYRAYAEWMNTHSFFSWLGKLIPHLRYDAKRYGY